MKGIKVFEAFSGIGTQRMNVTSARKISLTKRTVMWKMTPKFRAWLKKEQRMIKVCELTYIDDVLHTVSDENCDFYTDDDFILMQSTGLYDINGKEIYEGDIVKFFDCDDDSYKVPVVWDNDYACFSVDWGSNMLSSFDYLEEFYTDLKYIEVVGNIYENPGLLGGK